MEPPNDADGSTLSGEGVVVEETTTGDFIDRVGSEAALSVDLEGDVTEGGGPDLKVLAKAARLASDSLVFTVVVVVVVVAVVVLVEVTFASAAACCLLSNFLLSADAAVGTRVDLASATGFVPTAA